MRAGAFILYLCRNLISVPQDNCAAVHLSSATPSTAFLRLIIAENSI